MPETLEQWRRGQVFGPLPVSGFRPKSSGKSDSAEPQQPDDLLDDIQHRLAAISQPPGAGQQGIGR
jgi:hypothetical protein